MTLIAAFDPGVTTGVAWLENGVFHSDQFNEDLLYQWVDTRCEQFDHVQIEQFLINAGTIRKTIVMEPIWITGYLRYAAWRCGFTTAMTKPADVMKAFDDAALKRAGMHFPGHGHANDAARHLAAWMVRTRLVSGSVFLPK